MIKLGDRLGKLVVVEATSLRKNGYVVWKCKCDCGNEVYYSSQRLYDKKQSQTPRCSKCWRIYSDGKELATIAKETNVSYSTLWGRLHRKPTNIAARRKVDVGLDKPYSFAELSEISGVKRTTIIERFKRGIRGKALILKASRLTKPIT